MKYLPYLTIFILLVLLLKSCQDNRTLNQTMRTNTTWHDAKIKATRDSYGNHIATITAQHNVTRKQLQETEAKLGSTTEALQKEVRKSTHLAAVIRTQTQQVIITDTDTIYITSGDTLPTYRSLYEDKWIRLETTASADSVVNEYTVFNEFAFSADWKRTGLFKPKTLEASVKSLNPHTETIGLATFSKPAPKPKRWAWLVAGVGIGVVLMTVK